MKHFLLSLAFYLSLFPAFAQPSGTIGIGPAGVQAFADSLLTTPLNSTQLDDTVYYRIPLINAGNTTLTDSFTIDFVSITSLDSMETVIGSEFFNFPPLQPGDSFPNPSVVTEITTAARYGTGGGGVVVIIWPVARIANIATADSGFVPINLLPANIPASPLPIHVKFGPNPTRQLLHFSYGKDINKIERVIIRDVSGQIVLQDEGAPAALSLAPFPAGTYLLSVHTIDGQNAVFRVIKYGE